MKKRLFAVILICLALMLSIIPIGAAGWAGLIDTTKAVKLTVKYAYEGVPIEGMSFDIFYVASVDNRCENFTLASAFKKYADKITNMDNLANIEFTYDRSFTVKLGTGSKLEYKLERFASVIRSLTEEGKTGGTIDVSSDGETYYSP